MTLTKNPKFYNPFFDLTTDFFESNLLNTTASKQRNVPAVNVKETNDNYELYMAVPGIEKEDISIELDKNKLTISYDKEVELKNTEEEKYTRIEFQPSAFKRTFKLPENKFEEGQINASYQNGVLLISVPKKEEAKPIIKQIAVN